MDSAFLKMLLVTFQIVLHVILQMYAHFVTMDMEQMATVVVRYAQLAVMIALEHYAISARMDTI